MNQDPTPRSPLLTSFLPHHSSQLRPEANKDSAPYNENYPILVFYESTALLNIPREVALGYLILLTGGIFEYESPSLKDNTNNNVDGNDNLA